MLLIASVAVILGLVFRAPETRAGSPVKDNKDRKHAPEFALKDAHGKLVHLSDYRGKVVLLDFWATWCGPCGIEIPWFEEFERKYKDRGFEVLGVSMDDDGWKAINPFVTDKKDQLQNRAGRRRDRRTVWRSGSTAHYFRDRSRWAYRFRSCRAYQPEGFRRCD